MKLPLLPGMPILLYVRAVGPAGATELLTALDTGATYTMIPTEDALDLGYDLAAAPREEVMTANGLIQAPRIVLQEVSIGDLRARNVEALCHNMPGAQVSALLGLNFLESIRVNIDLKGRVLELEDP
ncbi:MAG: TIGR02281 family clan AA aspartic protease [Planctomycetes bacterium]|nr:TIGR02281 family clan AA aspartic protease [Planctomycetota bacterium]